jgi:NAD(P)-dependent dehydrogenase (short-subunit alcohol dehydrogenase family)
VDRQRARLAREVNNDLGRTSRVKVLTAAAIVAFAYNSSKTTLSAFTLLLAEELRSEGFRVNSVNPGFTATDLNGNAGALSVAQAAATVVGYATLDFDVPPGGFFTVGANVPW